MEWFDRISDLLDRKSKRFCFWHCEMWDLFPLLSLWQTPWQTALYFPDCHKFGMLQNYFKHSHMTWVLVCPDSRATEGVAGLNSDLHGRIPEMLVSIQSLFQKKKKAVEQSFCLCVSWTVASCFILHATISDLVTCLWHTRFTEVGIAQVTAGKHDG